MGTFPKDVLASLPVASGFLEHRGFRIFKKFQEVNCVELLLCVRDCHIH